MAFGQSIVAAFVASEAAGYIAERCNASPQDVKMTKCVVAAGAGTITAILIADPFGVLGSIVLSGAYLGGYDPLYLVVESFGRVVDGKPKGSGSKL